MSETDDISGLESALVQRAHKQAEEHLVVSRMERERILAETRQRLSAEEEHEQLAAKARAERAYQQHVQATELDLRADLDHLRRELTDTAFVRLPARLTELAKDEARYLPLLLNYLQEAALAIERDELIVQLNAHDLLRLQPDWERHVREVAPGKHLTLSQQPLDCIGGVLVVSADGNIRYDNTFEGRMERMKETLRGALAERLMPHQSGEMDHG